MTPQAGQKRPPSETGAEQAGQAFIEGSPRLSDYTGEIDFLSHLGGLKRPSLGDRFSDSGDAAPCKSRPISSVRAARRLHPDGTVRVA